MPDTIDMTTNISSSNTYTSNYCCFGYSKLALLFFPPFFLGGGGDWGEERGELIYGKVITILYRGNFDQYITLLLN